MSTTTPTPVLSSFTPLDGGFREAIAPGPRLVTLSATAATWWEGRAPITAELPRQVSVDGAAWTPAGALRVGLGTLDLAARRWTPDPVLVAWNQPGPPGAEPPLREVAWFDDAAHAALRLESAGGGGRTTEIVIVAADGRTRGRRTVDGATALAAAHDRVLVAAPRPVVLDLDGNVVAEPVLGSSVSVTRVRAGAGLFAITVVPDAIVLVRAADGAAVATWKQRASDAVPITGGVVAVDFAGVVRVGCVDGSGVRTAAEVDSHVTVPVVQVVGGQVVVAGSDLPPVRAATLDPPCH